MDREELKQILVKFCTPNEYGVDPDHKNVRCDYYVVADEIEIGDPYDVEKLVNHAIDMHYLKKNDPTYVTSGEYAKLKEELIDMLASRCYLSDYLPKDLPAYWLPKSHPAYDLGPYETREDLMRDTDRGVEAFLSDCEKEQEERKEFGGGPESSYFYDYVDAIDRGDYLHVFKRLILGDSRRVEAALGEKTPRTAWDKTTSEITAMMKERMKEADPELLSNVEFLLMTIKHPLRFLETSGEILETYGDILVTSGEIKDHVTGKAINVEIRPDGWTWRTKEPRPTVCIHDIDPEVDETFAESMNFLCDDLVSYFEEERNKGKEKPMEEEQSEDEDEELER